MRERKSAFLIDDDNVVNAYNHNILEGLNYFEDIQGFSDPMVALSKLSSLIKGNENLPSYIFLDVAMPEMDGFEFIEELEYLVDDHFLEEVPHVVIVTSSRNKRDQELFDKSPTAGFFIKKPLKTNDLKEKLKL